MEHYPQRADELRRALSDLSVDPATHRFLPVVARGDWSAVLDKNGRVVGYLPVDGFF